MAIDKENANSAAGLRVEAVAMVDAQAVATDSLSNQDVKRLYHELQIHQIELEMQNKELNLIKHDLEATRDSYFSLYDLAPVGYLTLNKDGLIQKANLTASTLLGFGKDALYNKPFQKFIFRDDIDSYYLQSRSAVEASEDFKFELRFVQPDGSSFWVNLHASLQNNGEIWITFNDISDRKQLEQALRHANDTLEEQIAERTEELCQQEERMRLALEAAKMAIWDWHMPTGNLIWNEMHYRMMGYEPGEVQPSYKAWANRVHPDDIDTVQRMIQESMNCGTGCNAEFRVRWPDGTVRWLEARWETKYSANNEPQRQYGVILDITERKQAEETIRKNEKTLSDIYASMSEGLALHEIVYDNFGKAVDYLIIEVNPAFESITGLERSTVIGKKASELFGTDEASYLDRYAEVASTGEPTSFEVHFVPMNKHFHISAFSPEKGGVATVFQDVTERNLNDKALRESEERHRVLAETMLQGVVHQDASGTIISMNPAAERILGKSRKDFLGNSSVDVEHDTIRENGEIFPGIEHPTMVALRTGLPVRGVVMGVFNPKLKMYRWIGIDAVPVFRPGEDLPAEVYSVFGDITERKQAESFLKESRNDLDRAQAVGNIGSWRLDVRSNSLIWSDENHRIFGIPKGTPLTYETFLSTIHPDDRQYVDSQWSAGLRGEPYDIEHRLVVEDKVKWVREKAYLEFDKNGSLIGGFGITQDITKRKLTEEALQQSEHRIQQALRVSRSFTFDWSPFTDQVKRSASCAAILNLTGDEAVIDTGEHYFQCIHSADRERFGQILRDLTPTADSYTVEYRYVRTDGREITLEETGQASFDAAGSILRLVGVSTDITVRKKAEEELRKVNDELELRIEERTSDLAKAVINLKEEIHERQNAEKALYGETLERLKAVETLREKEQMLIQQSRQAAMGEMIGNIAHQWRQPLNTLGLYTQALGVFYGSVKFNKEFLDNSIAKSMEIIQHMSKTIDDFRNYFKPEKEKADFYVIDAIKSSLSLLEGNFNNPKITIDFIEHDNPVINGYQNEFAQVFLNILNNARDAIIEREIAAARVTITICRENNCTVVAVADNAGGIPVEIINKVFDPYFTTKGPQLGTGIGLFMSKTIIEKNMGGKLTVRNTDDGAEFRIEVEHGTQN